MENFLKNNFLCLLVLFRKILFQVVSHKIIFNWLLILYFFYPFMEQIPDNFFSLLKIMKRTPFSLCQEWPPFGCWNKRQQHFPNNKSKCKTDLESIVDCVDHSLRKFLATNDILIHIPRHERISNCRTRHLETAFENWHRLPALYFIQHLVGDFNDCWGD